MKTSLSSGRPSAVPAAHEDGLVQPAWMGSSAVAVVITAVIAVSGILSGQWLVGALGIGYGWAFAVAGVVITAEMWGLFVLIGRLRAAYRRDHEQEPPLRHAA